MNWWFCPVSAGRRRRRRRRFRRLIQSGTKKRKGMRPQIVCFLYTSRPVTKQEEEEEEEKGNIARSNEREASFLSCHAAPTGILLFVDTSRIAFKMLISLSSACTLYRSYIRPVNDPLTARPQERDFTVGLLLLPLSLPAHDPPTFSKTVSV